MILKAWRMIIISHSMTIAIEKKISKGFSNIRIIQIRLIIIEIAITAIIVILAIITIIIKIS